MTKQWQEEFPDYPVDQMPAIPAHWVDASWHNDACPSFEIGNAEGPHIRVWVDYPDPKLREFEVPCRFAVENVDIDCNQSNMIQTDDWELVLTEVDIRERGDR